MDKATYLEALRQDSDDLMAAARLGLDKHVPATPAWTLGALVGHLVGVYVHWEKRVRSGAGESLYLDEDDLAPYPGLSAWFGNNQAPEMMPPGVLAWLERSTSTLLATLAAADPTMPVDTWFPPDQTAGFVQRRMAQETAVHRWDAESAHGMAKSIAPQLARDGIDEMLDVHLPMRREWIEPRPSEGERFHFHSTDGEGEWLVEFRPAEVCVSHEHAKGDVAVRGTASDLLLWLWGRIPTAQLEVVGNHDLAARWFELVPPD